jgi:hypothetical protein
MYTNPARSLRRFVVPAIIVGAALIVWLIASILISIFTFHVSKTDPGLKNVGAASAYIDVYFNKPIVTSSVKASYSEKFVSGFKASSDKVRFTFATSGMTIGKSYTINLVYVASAGGKEIKNKKLTFTAKNIAVSTMSQEQQKTLLGQQDKYPYAVQYIHYAGFDALRVYITSDQLETLKAQLYGYSNQVNQEFRTMTLVPKTLTDKVHDVQKDDFVDNLKFDVVLGGQTYHAHLDSNVVDGSLQLLLVNEQGAAVYDSNNV